MTTEENILQRCGLISVLTELEAQRKRAWARIGKSGLIIGLGCATLIAILQLSRAEPIWSILTGAGAFLTWAIISGYSQNSFTSNYKLQVIPRLLETITPGLCYEPSACIDVEEFNACGLFIRPDRYNGKDYVSGLLDKTAFRFSLIDAEEEVETTDTDSDGNTETRTHYNTIFCGLFFSADFNKHFSGQTRVFAGGTGFFSGLRGGLVKLEDPDFARNFTVYSNDQVEARYILSPALMQRLLDLRRRFDTKLQASFVGSRVVLAVPTQLNLLQPRFFRRADDPEVVLGYHTFLQAAVGLVEDLNLNRRIWSKS